MIRREKRDRRMEIAFGTEEREAQGGAVVDDRA
jgi:hypothetical protein